jgi:thiol:disulfide interchange protein
MAGALGAALVLPPAAALAVFAGLGLGLALPFLAVGFIPAVRRKLPRPGPWMVKLRAILSVPMFLTALALAWVLGRQAGVEGMTAGLAGALLLGLFLWWLGSRQAQGSAGWLPMGGALAAAVAAIVLLPVAEPASAQETSAPAALAAQRFSPEKLAALRASGTPVFLYMTADWCLTCKVNEKGAMADSDVAKAFKDKGIAVLEGDWTRGDPVISEWLSVQGRAGIPVYVFYAADGSEAELPQILTVEKLTSLG